MKSELYREIEKKRNDYMQYLADCSDDDSEIEASQAVFDVLEELLNE